MRSAGCRSRRAGLLHGPAAAHRRGASRRLALRRLDRGGARRRSAARRSWCRCPAPSIRTRPPTPRSLAEIGAATVIPQPEFTPERLASEIVARLDATRALDPGGRSGQERRHHRRRRAARRCIVLRLATGNASNETSLMKLPPKLGPIHFIGIGGIGMSGIAEVMHNLGYTRAGLRRVRQLQRQAPRREGHQAPSSATRPRMSTGPRSWSSRRRSSATIRSSRRRARSACRWCAAPRCWPS